MRCSTSNPRPYKKVFSHSRSTMKLSATGNFEKGYIGSLCFEDGDFTFVFTPDEAVVMAELLDAFFDARQKALK
jgi:hypothetical protein